MKTILRLFFINLVLFGFLTACAGERSKLHPDPWSQVQLERIAQWNKVTTVGKWTRVQGPSGITKYSYLLRASDLRFGCRATPFFWADSDTLSGMEFSIDSFDQDTREVMHQTYKNGITVLVDHPGATFNSICDSYLEEFLVKIEKEDHGFHVFFQEHRGFVDAINKGTNRFKKR